MPKEKDGMGQRIGKTVVAKTTLVGGPVLSPKRINPPPPPSKEKEKMKQEGGMIAVTTYTGTFSLSSSISDAIRDGQQDTFVGQKGRSSFKKKKNIHYEYMKKIIKYMYFRKRLMFTEWFPKKKKKCFGL